jgi:hypothetical protein
MRSVSGVFKDAPDKAISIARLPSSTDASLTTTRTFGRESIAEGLEVYDSLEVAYCEYTLDHLWLRLGA